MEQGADAHGLLERQIVDAGGSNGEDVVGGDPLGCPARVSRKVRTAATCGRTGAAAGVARAAATRSSLVQEAANAWCAVVQNWHWLREEVKAANSSRSPTVHDDGPRIRSCTSTWNGVPKYRCR
jgi:hypothetical protein